MQVRDEIKQLQKLEGHVVMDLWKAEDITKKATDMGYELDDNEIIEVMTSVEMECDDGITWDAIKDAINEVTDAREE